MPIGSAMGAPAVLVSRSIFLRIVQSLFHHDASTWLVVPRKTTLTKKAISESSR